jgi:CheY-like chemotaxis protein
MRGYESWAISDEDEAVELLRTRDINLFIQDVEHPGRRGWGFLRLLKSDPALRCIPVLMVSARPKNFQPDYVEHLNLDPDRDLAAYVELPVDGDELLQAVEECLGRSMHSVSYASSRQLLGMCAKRTNGVVMCRGSSMSCLGRQVTRFVERLQAEGVLLRKQGNALRCPDLACIHAPQQNALLRRSAHTVPLQ